MSPQSPAIIQEANWQGTSIQQALGVSSTNSPHRFTSDPWSSHTTSPLRKGGAVPQSSWTGPLPPSPESGTLTGARPSSTGLFHHVLFYIYMGDMHLVLLWSEFVYPGYWHIDNGATSKINNVVTEHGGILHVLPLAVYLKCFLTDKYGDHPETETPLPSFMLISYWWVGCQELCFKIHSVYYTQNINLQRNSAQSSVVPPNRDSGRGGLLQ